MLETHTDDRGMWGPGDDPTLHPDWERQVDMEQYMMRAGADRYRERVANARDKGQMTRLRPYRQLVEEWLPDLVEGIRDFLRDARLNLRPSGAGVLPVSYEYLERVDPYVAGYLTLRHVLDALSGGHTKLLSVAKAIGLALEHEERMRAWEARDKELFYGVKRRLKAQKATHVHRRRVNINRFNKLMREPLEWRDWPEYDRTRIGLDLIGILARYTGQFDIGSDPHHTYNPRAKRPKSPPLVLVASDEMMTWLTEAVDRAEVLTPIYLPTIIPPKRWEGMRTGGYYTEYVRVPHLIRFKVHQEEQRDKAHQEYDAIHMPTVYEALDALQEVPWRINRRVLAVAEDCWERDLAVAGMPPREDDWLQVRLPPRPEDMDQDPEAQREWRRQAAPLYRENAMRIAQVLVTRRTLQIADMFATEPAFYFPHMLDFRGRMYPIPHDLQPQGRDLARGLLEFAEGKPVTAEAVGWLAVHLANCWGFDKASYDERIEWVAEREDLWRRIAADPVEHREWATEADSPWQALAACLEWVRYLEEGEGIISHLPIRVDGTCNGLQHLSALVRDEEGGRAVNLVPGDNQRDIYKEVADRLARRLEGIVASGGEAGERAEWWLGLVDGDVPRSITKRPVMIMPYGGTREAYFQYTRLWLQENRPEVVREADPKWLGQHLAFLVGQMWEAVTETVSGGVATMKWLQDCARVAAEGDQPIFWRTPAGFVVRHFYAKVVAHRIKLRVDGQEFRVLEHRATRHLDRREQLKGIAPNFVHSLDAAALMLTLVWAREDGLRSLTAIHDAYGALAADMWALHALIRRGFLETHRVDMLGEYRASCKEVVVGHLMATKGMNLDEALTEADRLLPPPLPKGELDLEAVLDSDYFFA